MDWNTYCFPSMRLISGFSWIGAANHEGNSLGSLSMVSRKHKIALQPSQGSLVVLPHKIFVWEPNGVYLDYYFPNPVHGHFTEPGQLIGAHIREILSRSNSRILRQALLAVWKFREPQATVLTFERNEQAYQATVHCMASKHEKILGWVVDTPQLGQTSPSSGITWSLERYDSLTLKEKAILAEIKLHPILGPKEAAPTQDESRIRCIRMGPSNEELAQKRKVTVRTIKAHVTNIYHKLQIVSPHHSPTHRQT